MSSNILYDDAFASSSSIRFTRTREHVLQAVNEAYARCEAKKEEERLSRLPLIGNAWTKIENALKTLEYFDKEVYVNLPELTKEERSDIEKELTKTHSQLCVCANVEKNVFGKGEDEKPTWISIELFAKK